MDDTVLFPVIIALIVVYLVVTIVGALVYIWRTMR